MKKLRRIIASLLPVLLLLTLLTGSATAALQAVGPLDLPAPPGNGFATWYQDSKNVALVPCLSYTVLPGGPACLIPPAEPPFFDPALPIEFPTNFPFENFYFNATVTGPATLPSLLYEAALEGTFASAVPEAGSQVTFTRIRIRMDAPVAGTYTVIHPYGTETFNVTTPGVKSINMTRDLGINLFPSGPLSGDVGPWLVRVGFPQTFGTETFIGDPGVPGPVTGSPTGNNFVRVNGPVGSNIGGAGINTVTITNFAVMGKVFTGQIPSPLTIDRTTYARDAASGQIDVFVTALPTAIPSISGTGITTTALTQDFPATGKFFAHLPLASSTLPATLNITNSLDVPPILNPVALVDEVVISQSFYNPVTRNLTIKADSRDDLAPLPTLTVPQLAAPNTLDATGTLVKTLAANTIPPLTVTVHSNRGGSATALVSVVTPPAPPVAVADAATTAASTAVVINVLANDTTTGTLDPATIVTAAPVGGTAVASPIGTVTFTPTAGFSGAASFTYTVKDTFGQTSNSVTVAVTVTPPISLPVANNDTATTPASSTVVINVIANDTATAPATINPASLTVSAATGGTAAANLDGTVSYTAPATPGTYTFTYSVKDTATTPATTNVATVTVTVTVALPVAPTLVGPNGTVATATPVFTWNAVANATSYTLWNGNSGFTTLTATAAGCPDGTGTCSTTLATPLPAGTVVTWAVRATNASGSSPYSAVMRVTFSNVVAPVAPTLVGPNGTVLTATPTYTWNAVANATSYTFWNANSGFTTLTATAAGCPLGTETCSATPATPLPAGTTFAWAVSATNSAGTSPYSAVMHVRF